MSNYGASANKLVEALDVDFPTAKRLVEGYKQTFKGVVDFGKWIQNRTYTIDKFPNLFNRKYCIRFVGTTQQRCNVASPKLLTLGIIQTSLILLSLTR